MTTRSKVPRYGVPANYIYLNNFTGSEKSEKQFLAYKDEVIWLNPNVPELELLLISPPNNTKLYTMEELIIEDLGEIEYYIDTTGNANTSLELTDGFQYCYSVQVTFSRLIAIHDVNKWKESNKSKLQSRLRKT